MTNFWKSTGAGALLIVLLTAVAYLPALRGGFIWDDDILITENRMVRADDGLRRFWLTTEAHDYWPLTSTVWWLEWRLWGGNAMGYHVVNVLLHAVNAVLVWMILRRLSPDDAAWTGPGAWLAAVVFAIHPVNVSSVAWISEQKNTLSMLFYALSVLLYLRFDDALVGASEPLVGTRCDASSNDPEVVGRARSRSAPLLYALSLLAYLLALLSKAGVVMLPFVLLGCVWWRHGRVRWKDFLRTAPFFVLSLVLGLITVWFQYHRVLGDERVLTGGFASRLAAAGWKPWFYLWKTLWPVDLMMIYPKRDLDPSRWMSYLPGAILLGCLLIFWLKRKTWGRSLLFGLGYFVLMLFPVLGFFDQSFYQYSTVADHWLYYSIVGAIALVIAGGQKICGRLGRLGWWVGGLMSAVLVVALAVATWTRSRVYADSETLWRDNVAKNPHASGAHNNLGFALEQASRMQEAMRYFGQALLLDPNNVKAHNNLGTVLAQMGRVPQAIGQFEMALEIAPHDFDAHCNLGRALASLDKPQEAIEHYEHALRVRPDDAQTHYDLGNVYLSLGKTQEAVDHWAEAVRIRPDYAEAYNNLGAALAQAGQLPEAIERFDRVVQLTPYDPEAHYNLAVALQHSGRVQEAIGRLEQALLLKPDYAEAKQMLAALQRGQRTR